jgi:hypothetical protein
LSRYRMSRATSAASRSPSPFLIFSAITPWCNGVTMAQPVFLIPAAIPLIVTMSAART